MSKSLAAGSALVAAREMLAISVLSLKIGRGKKGKNRSNFDGFSQVSTDARAPGISSSEILGSRYRTQQDATFVGTLAPTHAAVAGTKKFFENAVAALVSAHSTCNNGTTLCSTVVTPATSGEKFPKITTANLGDSRASIVIKYKDLSGTTQYTSVSLTEDQDPKTTRFAKLVRSNGGTISKNKVVSGTSIFLGVAGAIGDQEATGLIRIPEVWDHDITSICGRLGITATSVEEIDLVQTCDGVWETGLIKNNHKLTNKSRNTAAAILADDTKATPKLSSTQKTLAALKQEFDELDETIKNKYESFSNYVTFAAYHAKSTDNISVIHVPLFGRAQQTARLSSVRSSSSSSAATRTSRSLITAPIMATVCDGHGSDRDVNGEKVLASFDLHENDKKNKWDGSLVSASVAGRLYTLAQVQPIPGLELNTHQALLQTFKARTIGTLAVEQEASFKERLSISLNTKDESTLNKAIKAIETYARSKNPTTLNALNEAFPEDSGVRDVLFAKPIFKMMLERMFGVITNAVLSSEGKAILRLFEQRAAAAEAITFLQPANASAAAGTGAATATATASSNSNPAAPTGAPTSSAPITANTMSAPPTEAFVNAPPPPPTSNTGVFSAKSTAAGDASGTKNHKNFFIFPPKFFNRPIAKHHQPAQLS